MGSWEIYHEPSPIEMQIGGSPIPWAMGWLFFYDGPMDGSEGMFFELNLPHLSFWWVGSIFWRDGGKVVRDLASETTKKIIFKPGFRSIYALEELERPRSVLILDLKSNGTPQIPRPPFSSTTSGLHCFHLSQLPLCGTVSHFTQDHQDLYDQEDAPVKKWGDFTRFSMFMLFAVRSLRHQCFSLWFLHGRELGVSAPGFWRFKWSGF